LSNLFKKPSDSEWDGKIIKPSGQFGRKLFGKTTLHRNLREAIYHGTVLGERLGTYSLKDVTKPDGSLKPFSYDEASLEDREIVSAEAEKAKEGR
jgi:hypothetical protein